jgi:Holliday junction DNA helicase RuvA
MIGYLQGHVRLAGGTPVVVAGGVGYLVTTAHPLEPDTDIELIISAQTRDTGTRLYGFVTENEQQLFDALCAVAGIGPSTAMAVLALGVAPVVQAVAANDAAAVARAAGVGKRTAASIVALAKVDHIDIGDAGELPAPAADDIADALVNLGFPRNRVTATLADIRAQGVDDDNTLLRDALNALR